MAAWKHSWLAFAMFVMLMKVVLPLRGRYTRDIKEFHILVPRKVHADGSLMSFELPHFYDRRVVNGERFGRWRRAVEESGDGFPSLHYALNLTGEELLVELWPNHDLLSPAAVVESFRGDVRGAQVRTARTAQCHWTGRVRGHAPSHVALSTCGGLAGTVRTDSDIWMLEPGYHGPDASGRHSHMVFRADTQLRRHRRHLGEEVKDETSSYCRSGRWRRAWGERFRTELRRNPYFLHEQRQAAGIYKTRRYKRFLELLLVADKRFIDYHKDDAENYLLTIANVANDLWRDASTGRYFVLSVTRIMMLEKDLASTDLYLSQDAGPVLDSFSQWAYKINPKSIQHPNHHDIAVLVTRYDICSDNMTNCNLLGLANLAQACNPEKSACINEDAGLIAGITTAHEIGHVMGAQHDLGGNPADPTGCPLKDETGAGWVMSAMLGFRTGVWSNCSRAFFDKFIESGLGDCLLDEPPDHVINVPEVLPGVMYDANHQCKFYLNLEKQCDWKKDEICKQLWCEKAHSCVSDGKPAAEGTSCGEGLWCYGERCVAAGRRPHGVDGGWSTWGPWSACSRSCGGGVESRVRLCNCPTPSLRGRQCLGESKQFRVCNVDSCVPAAPSFLQSQCSEFDTRSWWADGRTHTWRSVRIPGQECRLNCANELNTWDTLATVAADGTPCRPGARDLCVQGKCQNVGCDWVLLSEVEDDVCGICGGDGSHCRMEQMLYNDTGQGYTKILEVPIGAYNLRVEELHPANNLIAIADKNSKKFYLSGYNTQYVDGEYELPGGVKGVYSNPEKNRELLIVKGPLTTEMSVYYAFFGKPVNPGVKITWFLQKESDDYLERDFKWEFLEWQPCDSQCGGGTQVSDPECVEKVMGKVSSTFCRQTEKPGPMTRKCNEEPCKARWVAGEWGPCSGCIFRSGLQRRQLECMRDNPRPGAEPILLDEHSCTNPRPLEVRLCNNKARCAGERKRRARVTLAAPSRRKEGAVRLGRNISDRCEAGTPVPFARSSTYYSDVVLDAVPESLLLLMEAPVAERSRDAALSEDKEKILGDALGNKELDTRKETVRRGKDAIEALKIVKVEAEQMRRAPRPI